MVGFFQFATLFHECMRASGVGVVKVDGGLATTIRRWHERVRKAPITWTLRLSLAHLPLDSHPDPSHQDSFCSLADSTRTIFTVNRNIDLSTMLRSAFRNLPRHHSKIKLSVAQSTPAKCVRNFHPLAGSQSLHGKYDPHQGNLVPMVIEQTVRSICSPYKRN